MQTRNPLYIWGDKDYSIQNILQLNSIVEYSDTNGNLLYDLNESVQIINFEKNVNWNFSQETNNESMLIFTLYTVSINQSGFEQLQINLTNYLFSGQNYIKFNVEILNWPWVSFGDRLGLNFRFLLSGVHSSSDSKMNTKNAVSQNNEIVDGIYISDKDNNTIGYLLSNNIAFKGFDNESIIVKNQFIIHPENNSATIVLNYPYFGNYLFHDPIIGSNGDTFKEFSQLYSILIEKSGLLIITSFLSVLSLITILFMRKRK